MPATKAGFLLLLHIYIQYVHHIASGLPGGAWYATILVTHALEEEFCF